MKNSLVVGLLAAFLALSLFAAARRGPGDLRHGRRPTEVSLRAGCLLARGL